MKNCDYVASDSKLHLKPPSVRRLLIIINSINFLLIQIESLYVPMCFQTSNPSFIISLTKVSFTNDYLRWRFQESMGLMISLLIHHTFLPNFRDGLLLPMRNRDIEGLCRTH